MSNNLRNNTTAGEGDMIGGGIGGAALADDGASLADDNDQGGNLSHESESINEEENDIELLRVHQGSKRYDLRS